MKIELRNPNVVMKLSRLGSFHQSKLSFLRSFLMNLKIGSIKEIFLISMMRDLVAQFIHLKKKIEFTLLYVLQIK